MSLQVLEVYVILFCLPFGFRNGHSTDHALVNRTENMKFTLDKGKLVCGRFMDRQKAFDSADYIIFS